MCVGVFVIMCVNDFLNVYVVCLGISFRLVCICVYMRICVFVCVCVYNDSILLRGLFFQA